MDPVTGVIFGAAITGVCGIIIEIIRRPERKKINEAHYQLTQNGGKSYPPTIPDQLHSINKKLEGQDLILIDLKQKLDRHIEWHLEQKK